MYRVYTFLRTCFSRRQLLLAAGLFLIASRSEAQRIEYFTIRLPEKVEPVASPRYGRISVIDARFDTTCYGVVSGLRKKGSLVHAQPALDKQLQLVVDHMGGTGANELVLQLRDFRFAELNRAFREEGHFYFRANLFARKGDHFSFLTRIDSTIYVEKHDATSTLFKEASQLIYSVLRSGLAQEPTDSVMSIAEINAVDSIERSRLPLYTTQQFQTGIYYTFASLAQQTPDIIELMPRYNKKGRLKEVKIHMGEEDQVMEKTFCYAVVDKGKIWMSTEFGYFELKRVGAHFEFDGMMYANAATSKVIIGALNFGILGALAASDADAYKCYMRVNHLTGDFIPLKMGERAVLY